MAKVLAYYLPQYHPIPENDHWYGKGFTEWTNVAKARPLFRGHYQPHVPADLGFYDLRMPETIKAQTDMAKKYGVDGFCYWHYWFGNGKRLLERPFQDLVNNKSIDFTFALAWANETWYKKLWSADKKDEVIAQQVYGGEEDYIAHFYALLPAFQDPRYIRVDGRLFFEIYRPLNFPEVNNMMRCWNQLAEKEGLGGFYFVAEDASCRNLEMLLKQGFDAISDNNTLNIHHNLSLMQKVRLAVNRELFHRPTIFRYRDAIKHMLVPESSHEQVIPQIAPNWDHTPRSRGKGFVLTDADPKYFEQILRETFQCIKHKPEAQQIIAIRAWNEWGEGNHLEPDLKYGLGYLEALKKVRDEMGM